MNEDTKNTQTISSIFINNNKNKKKSEPAPGKKIQYRELKTKKKIRIIKEKIPPQAIKTKMKEHQINRVIMSENKHQGLLILRWNQMPIKGQKSYIFRKDGVNNSFNNASNAQNMTKYIIFIYI